MCKLVFTMSQGQAENYPDRESRVLTVETTTPAPTSATRCSAAAR